MLGSGRFRTSRVWLNAALSLRGVPEAGTPGRGELEACAMLAAGRYSGQVLVYEPTWGWQPYTSLNLVAFDGTTPWL